MMKIFLKIFVFEHSSFCQNSQFRINLTTSPLRGTPPIFLRKTRGELLPSLALLFLLSSAWQEES